MIESLPRCLPLRKISQAHSQELDEAAAGTRPKTVSLPINTKTPAPIPRRIKEQTLAQFPRQTVKTWTPFFTTVAMFLRQTNLKINIDEKIVNTMVGLASFGVENQESLLAAAGNKMDGVLFDTRLKPMGVPGLICAMLFTEFVESKALTLLDVCSI